MISFWDWFRSAWTREIPSAATAERATKDIVNQISLFPIAVAVGVATGYAVLGFRLAITWIESSLYGADSASIHSHAASLEWWHVLLIPIVGGLIVGQILVHLSLTTLGTLFTPAA